MTDGFEARCVANRPNRREVARLARPTSTPSDWFWLATIAVAFVLTYPFLVWPVRLPGNPFSSEARAGITTGFGIAIFVMSLARLVRRLRLEESLANGSLPAGGVVARFRPDGLEVLSPLTTERLDWRTVQVARETRRGVGLRFAGARAVFAPDAGLPAGLDRAEALRRIEDWRAAATNAAREGGRGGAQA